MKRLLALLAVALLAGCAAPPQDIRTASDMTDDDRRARLRLELASGYFARGQPTTALDEVKQALAARPDLPEGYSLRGLIYASLGEQRLAEESFQRALQLDPRSGDTLHNYGWFLCQLQRWDEAAARFDQAIANPQYRDVPRTLQAKGLCEARAGRLREAERNLSRAYEMDPSNPGAAFILSDVLYRLGEFERARFYLRRVNADAATSNAQTLWLAARIEHRLGNEPGVRTLGEQLQRRFPQSPEALQYERGRFDG
ncbi:MAG: type IV pilus biogenesis/stability protein PilW [Rubrivivax sp.]